ncbi:MAG: hypothetical protein HRU38_15305 [Saccharospirillaceae bacterium]|nr:hypothetical protein [Pseudomonadales bacterium]NRB80010.1 hypothetical protein [Saccharospirillaceae bacterium]
MNDFSNKILFDDARKIAEREAYFNLKYFMSSDVEGVLSDTFIEGKNCWMFFRNANIIIPPEGKLRGEWAYVISKFGETRQVADLSFDQKELNKYLIKMSNYFEKN